MEENEKAMQLASFRVVGIMVGSRISGRGRPFHVYGLQNRRTVWKCGGGKGDQSTTSDFFRTLLHNFVIFLV